MAEKDDSFKDATAKGGSLNSPFGIGELSDGSFNTFPVSELAARTAERDRQEQADDHAFQQSEAGFPTIEDGDGEDPFLESDDDLDLGDDDEEDD